MKRIKLITIPVLLLAACAGIAEPEVALIPTETIAAAAETDIKEPAAAPDTLTPSPTLTETSPPPPTATFTPTPTSSPEPVVSKLAPIIAKAAWSPSSFMLVGGSQNGNWLNHSEVAGNLSGNSNYQLFINGKFEGWIFGHSPTHELLCDQYYVSAEPFSSSQSAVGVAGDWTVMPRLLQELPADTEVYLQTVAGWLVEQAPSQPIVAINKIWKADVEGNGTDEVFISASRFGEPSGHNVEPRDYSVILMRTVDGSEVKTISLVGDYYAEAAENSFPWRYSLELIGDLNGDGRMEVVVGLSRWEGSGVMVFEIEGQEVHLVLSIRCSL